MFLLSIAILIVFLGASLFAGRSFVANQWIINPARIYKYLFLAAIILIFTLSVFQSYQQYRVWAGNDLSKHLLPPYQNINYFIFYVFTRFFAPYLISLVMACLFMFSAKILNKKFGERFFEPEEIYLGGATTFLVGHPGWLFYATILLVVYLIIHLYSLFIISVKGESASGGRDYSVRISLYWLWIPTAIFVIIIMNWLETLPWWSLLKV